MNEMLLLSKMHLGKKKKKKEEPETFIRTWKVLSYCLSLDCLSYCVFGLPVKDNC